MSTYPTMTDEAKESSEKSYYRSNPTDTESVEEEKSIGVHKAEILANQWKHTFWYKVILGFSAFLCGYAYGLDRIIFYFSLPKSSAKFIRETWICRKKSPILSKLHKIEEVDVALEKRLNLSLRKIVSHY